MYFSTIEMWYNLIEPATLIKKNWSYKLAILCVADGSWKAMSSSSGEVTIEVSYMGLPNNIYMQSSSIAK